MTRTTNFFFRVLLGLLLFCGFPPLAWGAGVVPTITWDKPYLSSSTLNLQPTMTIRVFDGDGNLDWNTAVLTVNGQRINNWKTTTEEALNRRDNRSDTVKYTPSTPFKQDSLVQINFLISDQTGNTVTGTWTLAVSSYRDMRLGVAEGVYTTDDAALISANTKACTSCHNNNTTLQQNHSRCANCHGTNMYLPKRTILTNQSTTCIYCHYGKQFTNGYAHTTAINSGTIKKPPQHQYIDQLNTHNSNAGENCLQCHSKILTREHLRRTDSQGKELNCSVCHNTGTTARVQMAVANHNISCSACHDGAAHEEKHTANLDANCQTCHKATLSMEHLQNPATQKGLLTCDSCHSSTLLSIRTAIASNSTYCGSCHNQGHGLNIADQVSGDVPLMPGLNWAAPEEAALWAGEWWMPADLASAGKLVMAERKQGVVAQQVYQYYLGELMNQGWSLNSTLPAADAPSFSLSFSKPPSKLLLWYYKGVDHTGIPQVQEGSRVEVIYAVETN